MELRAYFKPLCIYLAFAMMILTLPAQGWAMFVPSAGTREIRDADLASIQKTLESTVVKQRLMDYGLSADEALARVNGLSNAEVHRFAQQLDSLQAGADGAGTVIFLLMVAILVVVILEITGHRVVIK